MSDLLWVKEDKELGDGEICIYRFKYDSIHLNEQIEGLYNVTGDTQFRYANMTDYVTIEV